MLVKAAIFRQRFGVSGPQLAQREIHELPPCRRAVADEKQILRREEHRVQHVAERSGVFRRYAVDGHFPLFAAIELDVGHKLPVTGQDAALQHRARRVEADQLPVSVSAGRFAAGEIDNRLQQIGLALGIFAVDHVAVGVEGQALAAVVAKARKAQLIDPHRPRPVSCRRSPRCRRGGAFCPAGCRLRH